MRFENRKIIVVLAIVITLAAVLICPVNPARATFPGKNGRISFLEVTDVVNVYTINPDGSDERQLTSFGPDNSVFNSAEWSSDGRQLVFPAGPVTVSGPGQIWVMNADGSNQHILFSDPAGLDLNTIFSPDGNYIVFTRCQGGGFPPCAIYRIRSDGSELTALTNFDPNPDVVDAFPNYSPDGRQIAFTSLTRGGILEAIYVMDSDGSDIRRLTPPAIGASSANWSPDGESIMFDTNDGFCGGCFFPNSEIWSIGADGRNLKRLTGDPNFIDVSPSWAPQGDAIVFEQDDPSFTTSQIFLLKVGEQGTSATVIHKGSTRKARGTAGFPTPAGKNQTRNSQLKLIEDDGGAPRWGPASH